MNTFASRSRHTSDRFKPGRRGAFAFILAPVALLALPQAAEATHFRGGNMFVSVSSGGQVTLTIESLWRRRPDGTDADGFPFGSVTSISVRQPGSTSDLTRFSVNGSATTVLKQTFDTHHFRRQVISTSFPALGQPQNADRVFYWTSCCRIGGLANAPESTFSLSCSARWTSGQDLGSPRLGSQVITTVFKTLDGSRPPDYSQNINANDPDQPLTYQFLVGATNPDYGANYTIGTPGSQGYSPTNNSGGFTQPISPSPFLDSSYRMSIDSNGQVRIPGKTIVNLQDLNPRENASNASPRGDYVFKLRVTDATGLFSDRDVLLDVDKTSNDPPATPQVTGNPSIRLGDSLGLAISSGDSDAGDTVTLAATGLPAWMSFSTSPGNPAVGTLSGTPTQAGDVGTHTIQINATDNGAPNLSSSTTVTVNVTGENLGPQLTFVPNQNIATDPGTGALLLSAGVTITITVTATDPNPNDTLVLDAFFGSVGTLVAGSSFTQTGPNTGLFSWTPSPGSQEGVWGPGGGPTRPPLSLRVRDDGNPHLQDTQQVTLSIGPTANASPTLLFRQPGSIASQTSPILLTEGSSVGFDLVGRDPNPADQLTVSNSGTTPLPAGASLLRTSPPAGGHPNPVRYAFAWTTAPGDAGTYDLEFFALDNGTPPVDQRRTMRIIVAAPVAPPSISSLVPNQGDPAGGTTVTVTGTGFTGATSVLFGNPPGPVGFTELDDGTLTFVTPGGAVGSLQDISVTTPDGSDTRLAAFQYDANPDTDGDGLPDCVETAGDTDGDGLPDLNDPDSDGDGIPDAAEAPGLPGILFLCAGASYTIADTDRDGTPDYLDLDSDGDGLFDADEGEADQDGDGTPNYRDLDLDGDGVADDTDNCPFAPNGNQADLDGDGEGDVCDDDTDNDGLPDTLESILGTDPASPDTDGEGLGDGVEVNTYFTDPLAVDSDGDTLTDFVEVTVHGTDPTLADSDVDGLQDDVELAGPTDPLDDDTDDDQVLDGADNCPITPNPSQGDADGDGIGDACENQAPLAVAVGGTVIAGLPLALDGSGSSDPDPADSLAYSWTIIASPLGSTPVLTNTTSAAPTFTGDLIGTYTVELTVDDGNGGFSTDTATVTVTPAEFTISASAATIAEDGGAVTFTVTRTGLPSATLTIDNFTFDYTTSAGLDYIPTGGILTFGPGVTTQTFDATIIDDADVENTETFFGGLDAPSSSAIITGTNPVAVEITDNEGGAAVHEVGDVETFVSEGAGAVDVTIVRSGDTSEPSLVACFTGGITATAGADYAELATTVFFGAGEMSRTVTVTILEDTLAEPQEQFTVGIENPGGGTIGAVSNGFVFIVDNEVPSETLTLAATEVFVGEDEGTATVVVNRSGDLTGSVTVEYSSVDLTATAPADYGAVDGVLTFGPGETTQTISVSIVDDADPEAQERCSVLIFNPGGAVIAGATATDVVIDDNEAGASVLVAPVSLTVGEADGSATVTIVRSGDTAETATCDYFVVGLTAQAGSDYLDTSGTLTFGPGLSSATIVVNLVDDADAEPTEQLAVVIENPGGATISPNPDNAPGSAATSLLILDDESPTALLSLPETATVGEGDGSVTITVTRSGDLLGTATCEYATYDQTARAPEDYTQNSGTLTFGPGVTAQDIVVTIGDDLDPEPTEQFAVVIENAGGATILPDAGSGPDSATTTVSITDNEPVDAVLTLLEPLEVREDGGTMTITVTVTRPPDASGTVSCQYRTADGVGPESAVQPGDYVAVTGSLSFPPGVLSQDIVVQIVNDAMPEETEQFRVIIENPSGATITANAGDAANSASATCTITDDDTGECADDDDDAECTCTAAGDVLLASGEERFDRVDLVIPGRAGLDFRWRRRYRSRIDYDGPLGLNWDFDYNEHLLVEPNGDVLRVNGRSRTDRWRRNPDGSYGAPTGNYRTLVRRSDGTYVLRAPDGFKRVYGSDGRLVAHEDRHGNRLLFFYDSAGNLTLIVDTYGREIRLEYQTFTRTFSVDGSPRTTSRDRVVRLVDFSGRVIRYGYDAAGDLRTATTPAVEGTSTGNDFPDGRTERYDYTTGFEDERKNHNLIAVTYPEEVARGGPPGHTWTYGSDPGDPSTFDRVLTETIGGTNASGQAAGGTRTYSYAQLDPATSPYGTVGRARVTDRNGNVAEYFVDDRLHHVLTRRYTRGLRAGEPAFYETRSEFNPDGKLVRRIFPEGNEVRYRYGTGSRGAERNVIELRQVAGPRGGGEDLVTTFSYEPLYNRRASVTDPRGNAASFVPPLGTPSSARYTTRFRFDYQEGSQPVAEALEFGIDLSGVARGLGDLNGDGRTDQVAGNVVRTEKPSVLLRADSREAQRRGSTTQAVWTETVWNDRGQVLAEVDAEGNVSDFFYYPENDPDGDGLTHTSVHMPLTTAPLGYLQRIIRDARTSARRTASAAPTALETRLGYDRVGNVTSVSDPRGVVTAIEVNALNEAVVVTRGADITTAVGSGQLITGEAAFRYETRRTYDHNGRVVRTEVENRDGTTAGVGAFVERTFAFDILGELIRATVEVDAATTLTTAFRYDANQNPTRVTKPEGNVVERVYDERNLVLTTALGAGTPEASITRTDYDRNGNRVRVVDAEDTDGDGAPEETLVRLDGFDRPVEVEDALGNRARTSYDVASNVIRQQVIGHPAGQPGAPGVLLGAVRVSHDELNRSFRVDEALFLADGSSTLRPVDLRDEDGDGLVTSLQEFDALGRATFATEDDGETTETVYDGASRALARVDALGNRLELAYDRNSNAVEARSVERSPEGLVPDEVFTTRYVYDQLDRLVRVTDNAGQTTRLGYDSRDNLISRSDPEGPLTSDPLGLFPGQVNAPGNTTAWLYDGLDRQIRQVSDLRVGGTGAGAIDTANPFNPDGQVSLGYEYDGNSRLVGIMDDNGNRTAFGYDALDRKVSHAYADGDAYAYVYDRDHNLVQITDPNGSVLTRTYDALDRLVRCDVVRALGVGGTTLETYEYDGLSRLTRCTDDNGGGTTAQTCERVYDSLSRLLEERQNGQAISNVFAGDGKRVACVYPGGRRIANTFDALDRVKTTGDAAGTVASYDWIGAGMRALRRVNGNGTVLSFLDDTGTADLGYDAVRRVTRMRWLGADGTAFVDREYGYNRADQRTFERRHEDAGLTDAYGYDSLYRIVSTALDQGGLPGANTRDLRGIDYVFDGVGNRRQVDSTTNSGGVVSEDYAVNSVNQYTAKAGVGRAHSSNGNLVGDGTRTFVYDVKNRLVLVSRNDGTPVARYLYHCDNRRARKTVFSASQPGVVETETAFFYDGWQVCEEQTAGGATESTFVYSPVYVDEVVQVERVGAGALYLHQNARADVVAVTDGVGAVVERRVYDDYGRAVDGAKAPVVGSAVGNPYGFQGRRLDAETGLYYFRNRYYDPGTGRFLQRDPVWDVGNVGGQCTFVGNGAVSRVDPHGLSSTGADIVASAIENVVGNATFAFSAPSLTEQQRQCKIDMIKNFFRSTEEAESIAQQIDEFMSHINDVMHSEFNELPNEIAGLLNESTRTAAQGSGGLSSPRSARAASDHQPEGGSFGRLRSRIRSFGRGVKNFTRASGRKMADWSRSARGKATEFAASIGVAAQGLGGFLIDSASSITDRLGDVRDGAANVWRNLKYKFRNLDGRFYFEIKRLDNDELVYEGGIEIRGRR